MSLIDRRCDVIRVGFASDLERIRHTRCAIVLGLAATRFTCIAAITCVA
jgi:hypothetical protein